MVYKLAAQKTGSFMLIALVSSVAVVMLLSGNLTAPTGRAIGAGVPAQEGTTWIIFLLGMAVGALVIGAYTYVANIEAKRKE